MVVTRSQTDAAEQERYHDEREMEHLERERQRGLSLNPPESASLRPGATEIEIAPHAGRSSLPPPNLSSQTRPRSPAHSMRSQRSSASVATQIRLAEVEAEQRMAAEHAREIDRQMEEMQRKKTELRVKETERELTRKKLVAELAVSRDDQENPNENEHYRKVDTWLRTQSLGERGDDPVESRIVARDDRQLPVPATSKDSVAVFAEAVEKFAKSRTKCPDLQTFSGLHTEWLAFKAAVEDSKKVYNLTKTELLQRLRSCLKGEDRENVSGLLHSEPDPDVIMKALERCYWNPELIIERALEDLKKLPGPATSAVELNIFAVKVHNIVCIFEAIGQQEYLFNPMIAKEVVKKLSPAVLRQWCQYATDHRKAGTYEPKIVMLSRFLNNEADQHMAWGYVSADANAKASSNGLKKEKTISNAGYKKKASAIYNVAEEEVAKEEKCVCCEKTHKLPECAKYKALSVEGRWDLVRENKLCFKCITKKHRHVSCKAKSCGVEKCRRPHHRTLHLLTKNDTQGTSKQLNDAESVLAVATSTATAPRKVLLKMRPVTVVGPRGEVKTHALLDEGATITLIDEELARSVGAEGPLLPLRMQGVSMAKEEDESRLISVHLRSTDNALYPLRARTIKNMKLLQQSIPNALLDLKHLIDLPHEEVCYEATQPGILVGADHWEYIVSHELRVGKPNQPAASRTQLGWVIHGTVPRGMIKDQGSVLHVYTPENCVDASEQPSERLHDLVDRYFSIEALGIAHRPRVSEADHRATTIVENTIKKIPGGYEVGLPWKEEDPKLLPSYEAARRRLNHIERKMDANLVFKMEYTRQIDNLLQKGYAVPCDGTEQASSVSWYLPHFAVQNPNKPGKVRLVFDAAAKSRGVSLNDHLLEGPDLLMSLPGILFRFREKQIAVTADIQEMFLRVKIRPEDQPAQQFLWRGADTLKPPQCYKMTSMIFGAASSPFMAHYVRDYNAKVHAETHPLAYDAITRSHYMDDFVASYESNEDALRVVAEVRAVHEAAGFTLRAWDSNSRDVLRDVPEELRATTPTQLGKDGLESKILGLYWNGERDELGFNTAMTRVPAEVRARSRAPTKREALSAVMSIYDPLGVLSCYTIRSRIILQSLWRLTMTWDEPIPEEENELFANWLGHLGNLSSLRLQRRYALEDCRELELHILCDASEQAYATVAYWRITQHDGSVRLSLVAAKAKVAPRRTQTIPRLELQAAVIGARLADTIRKEHRLEVQRTVYWTDSMTVVHWIRQDARRYTPFVAHRLGELAELTHKNEWRWVPTSENVADDATRFTDTPITAEDRWFRGPDFLRCPEEEWPREGADADDEEEVLHVTEDEPAELWLPDPSRFSKYETLVRASARVLAFIDICRRRATRLELEHIERAERALLCRAQQESFSTDLQKIKCARTIPRTSRLFKLDPVLQDGLLRARGRIDASSAPAETKRPIILDGRHHITKLIVLKEHCGAGHANRERVTNDLRQKYWILHLRPTVRAMEHRCAFCRVRRARPRMPTTGDLPRARLDPYRRPFTNCGLDYFGPMVIKVGRRREKRWGALYTCLSTRAVHLELVSSLSTDSALMALRRMAARRGWPQNMYSDNATAFRGANEELRRAYSEWAPALREEGLLHRMKWIFIPPGAPNQGGAWERLVRSVKTALAVTLKEKAPAEEVLQTLLMEAEHSINARPLTHVSVSIHDPEALTPNHFLIGSSTGLPTTGPCDEADRRTWRASQALADTFWRRWVREYLPTLVPRGEPARHNEQLKIGDIVVVVDNTLPRNTWPRGIIERVYPGPDGGVRVADVRTRSGIFKRPTSKLAVLIQE